MDWRPRLFSSTLTRTQRRVYGAVLAWFVAALALMTWPATVPFARIAPRMLGMPFALFWLAALLVTSFLVALALFRWESREGWIDEGSGEDG